MPGNRFGLRSLFYVMFLSACASLALRLSREIPDFSALIVFSVAWASVLVTALISALLRSREHSRDREL